MFSLKDVLEIILLFIINIGQIKKNEIIVAELIGKHDYYIHNTIIKMINILRKHELIDYVEYSTMTYFDSQVNKFKNCKEQMQEIEIPDELSDPLWIL